MVAVAIGAVEWVDAVSGGRPVQDNWLVRRMSEVVPNLAPLGEGREGGGRERERKGGRERDEVYMSHTPHYLTGAYLCARIDREF